MIKPSADSVDIVSASVRAPIADAALAAELVFSTDPHIFAAMHAEDRALAARHLQYQWGASGGLFSYTFADAAVAEGALVGIELGFDNTTQQQALGVMVEQAMALLSEQELAAMLAFFEYGSLLLPAVPDDAYYLQNLAVVSAARGRGVGDRLLQHSIAKARKRGYRRLLLDVYEGNPAIRLYERSGLKTIVHTRVTPLAQTGMPDHLRMEILL